jgi:hypothetical protein
MDICVKYAQCVKIWPFVWKFYFIGYLCEICSMCKNMVIWCLGSVSDVCAVPEVMCSVSNWHYTESDNSSISDEAKGRRAQATRVSYMRRETRPRNACDVSQKCASSFYLTCTQKNIYILFSTGYPLRQHTACLLAHIRERMCANGYPAGPVQEAPYGAQVVWHHRSQ